MARTRGSAARKAESRVFRKLSRSFATKLGVDEPDAVMLNKTITVVKKSARRKRPKAANPQQSSSSPEKMAHDAEFLSLVERERAAMKGNSARQLSKLKRNKRNKRRSTLLKKQEKQQQMLQAEESDRKQPPNNNNSKNNNNTAALQFQPPTFSLQKSTAQLVNEAANDLHAFGIDSGYVPLPSEWTHRNPNHLHHEPSAADATTAPPLPLGHKQNFFATLQNDEQENETSSLKQPAAASKLFAFQPPSFTVGSAAYGDEIDPDL